MNNKIFFERIRETVFGGHISAEQVVGVDTILTAFAAYSAIGDARWLAYCLATAYHETAHTMKPIAEYGHGHGHPYGRPGPDGQCAYGRGFVQLTWRENYVHADNKLGLQGALIKNFELALEPGIAARVLIYGMIDGWFTKFKLSDYFNVQVCDWFHARRIINGVDRAALISGYAKDFYDSLLASQYVATNAGDNPA